MGVEGLDLIGNGHFRVGSGCHAKISAFEVRACVPCLRVLLG